VIPVVYLAVQHLASQLGQFLRRRHGLIEDIVVASGLVQPDGSPVPQAQNKLVLVLANIEKDTMPRSASPASGEFDGRIALRAAPLHLNLHILLAANFGAGSYAEALKFLSSAISYFQRTAVFDHLSSPDLPKGIERLVLDIENMRLQELSNLWSTLGAKHVPSILYKVRMVTIGGDDLSGLAPSISMPRPAVGAEFA
jgi:hypothetical protein